MLISSVQVTSWFDSVFIHVASCVNFRKSCHLKHDLQLLDYNLGKYYEQEVDIFGEFILFTISAIKGFQRI